MPTSTIGLVGFGRIGRTLADRIHSTEGVTLSFVYDELEISDPPSGDVAVLDDADEIADNLVDLVVEAADFRAMHAHAETVLSTTDLLTLSTASLANLDFHKTVTATARDHDTDCYVPHGAVLGMDGLQDARESLDEVSIVTRKNPENLDFSFVDDLNRDDVSRETVLYDGPARELCRQFPRNVNTHATVALAGLGFDDTKSKLIGDPDTTEATHTITAEGPGISLSVQRTSDITGVTGAYTLASIWETFRRIVLDDAAITIL